MQLATEESTATRTMTLIADPCKLDPNTLLQCTIRLCVAKYATPLGIKVVSDDGLLGEHDTRKVIVLEGDLENIEQLMAALEEHTELVCVLRKE